MKDTMISPDDPTHFTLPFSLELDSPDQQNLEQIPGDQYVALNTQLDLVYHEEIYNAVSQEFDPFTLLTREQPSLRPCEIDGRISDGTERTLLVICLDIIADYIDKERTLLSSEEKILFSKLHDEEIPWTQKEPLLISRQALVDQKEELTRFTQSVVAFRQAVGASKDIAISYASSGLSRDAPPVIEAQQQQELILAIEKTLPSVQGYKKTCLLYVHKELDASISYELFNITTKESYADLTVDDEFLSFISKQTVLSPHFVGKFKATPVDYMPSQQAQTPTLIVYLDHHLRLPVQKAIYADMVAFASLNPVFGFEDPQASQSYEVRFDILSTNASQRVQDLAFGKEYRAQQNTANLLHRQIRAFDSAFEKMYAQKLLYENSAQPSSHDTGDTGKQGLFEAKDYNPTLRRLQMRYELTDRRFSDAIDKATMISFAASPIFACSELSFEESIALISQNTDLLLGDNNYLGGLLELCLYEGGIYALGDAYPTIDIDTTGSYLLDDLIVMHRSRLAVDDVLSKMRTQQKPLGVMVMGRGHYQSIRSYLEQKGNVNVIFMAPTEYNGPMPE